MESDDKIFRYKERIKQRDFKLKTLLDITQAINENQPTSELLKKYRSTVEHDLQIRRLVLFMQIEDEWSCPLSYGVNGNYRDVDVASHFPETSEIKLLQSEKDQFWGEFDMLIPVYHKDRPLCYLMIGDIDEHEIKMSPVIKHMRFIQTLTNIIAVAIENKALFRKSLEQERTATELQLAAEMQTLMVGSGRKKYPLFDVATYYQPHQAIGGDFCDFIPLGNEEAFICMADVSGKGVSAAFLMATIQAHLRALIEHTNWTLESIAEQLNDKVNEMSRGDRFVTVFMAYFHYPTRMLHYLNAGHNPPVILNGQKTDFLTDGTVGIGMLKQLPFIHKGEVQLSRNAMLVLYTDGVVELENKNKEEFSQERIADLIKEKSEFIENMDEMVSHIIHALDRHRGEEPYFDDTALLCCRFI